MAYLRTCPLLEGEPIHTTWIRIGGKPLPTNFYVQNGTLILDNTHPTDAGEYNCLGRSTITNKTIFRVVANLKVLSKYTRSHLIFQ